MVRQAGIAAAEQGGWMYVHPVKDAISGVPTFLAPMLQQRYLPSGTPCHSTSRQTPAQNYRIPGLSPLDCRQLQKNSSLVETSSSPLKWSFSTLEPGESFNQGIKLLREILRVGERFLSGFFHPFMAIYSILSLWSSPLLIMLQTKSLQINTDRVKVKTLKQERANHLTSYLMWEGLSKHYRFYKGRRSWSCWGTHGSRNSYICMRYSDTRVKLLQFWPWMKQPSVEPLHLYQYTHPLLHSLQFLCALEQQSPFHSCK